MEISSRCRFDAGGADHYQARNQLGTSGWQRVF